jgi:hypothetical protein
LAPLSLYLAHLDPERCFNIGLQILLDDLERRLLASRGASSEEKGPADT